MASIVAFFLISSATLGLSVPHANLTVQANLTVEAQETTNQHASAGDDDHAEELPFTLTEDTAPVNFTEVDSLLATIHATVDDLKHTPKLVQNSTELQGVLKITRSHLLQLDEALDQGEKAEQMKRESHAKVGSLVDELKQELAKVNGLKQSLELARLLATVHKDLRHVEGLEAALGAAEAHAVQPAASSEAARVVEELKEQIEDSLPALATSVHDFTRQLQTKPELGRDPQVKSAVAAAQRVVKWIEVHPTLRARFALASAEMGAGPIKALHHTVVHALVPSAEEAVNTSAPGGVAASAAPAQRRRDNVLEAAQSKPKSSSTRHE